jgi:hypothetical protein
MSKAVTMATWDDVPHLTDKDKAEMLAAIPEWQRDARSKGVPQLGSGAIYPVSEDDVVIPPFAIPAFWPRGYALDVGWNCTCALFGSHDRETDTLYVYNEHYMGKAEPSTHATAIHGRGKWLQGVVDPAARGRSQKDGEQLIQNYRDLGLILSPAINGVESGIFEVWQRLVTGRLKFFSTLSNTRAEYRLYRRDAKGHVVKVMDHAMDTLRYLVMSGIHVFSTDPGYLHKLGHKPGVLSEYDPHAMTE